ncbi:hypothetical protein [Rheinheimera sp. EpRS3]|uniref:hypothetical protein n=1 Tax=Rheinheimera sp. EpRS3 TaxID=1712383 RepID=UPI00074A424F|nr:hypothetical protein [Rheinheimera sp. EpRS3]KUM53570.1 hypothetical protein AR688_06600 [Rheinheimera sp. EpRS3]
MDYEFSANCDLRNIAPFWRKIGDLIDGGISEEEVTHIERFAYSVKDNSHDVIQMSFSFQSARCELAFAIKVDNQSPEMLILSDSQQLIDAITEKHHELCNELGI